MEELMEFLRLVKRNNNREWFAEHKDMYLRAKQAFDNLASDLIAEVSKFDKSCAHLTLNECVYRFYRDIRFSKDKSPYKTHFGVYICPQGKKSTWAGYYFHIEPQDEETQSCSLLACGDYMPDKDMLQSIRTDILLQGDNYLKAIKKAKGFTLDDYSKLKTLPKGFSPSKYDELIKLKAHLLMKYVDDDFILDKNIVKNVAKAFKSTYDFVSLCNEAFSYSGNY